MIVEEVTMFKDNNGRCHESKEEAIISNKKINIRNLLSRSSSKLRETDDPLFDCENLSVKDVIELILSTNFINSVKEIIEE
jgi:hypothetical protein